MAVPFPADQLNSSWEVGKYVNGGNKSRLAIEDDDESEEGVGETTTRGLVSLRLDLVFLIDASCTVAGLRALGFRTRGT